MDIAITGSHGLIGSALCRSLTADGHTVRPVVRSGGEPRSISWDLQSRTIDAAGLEGVDAVVHLAGAGIASGRWTEEHKRLIRSSRTVGTTLLSGALAGLDVKPKVLVSGSAVGIFGGNRGDEVLTESSQTGNDFLARLCKDWEASTALAEEGGIRVAHIRSGIVLSAQGGALAKQLLPYKLGLGGRSGSGQQWMSWVSVADEVGAIRFLLDHDISGPVNVTGPVPVRNAEFAKTLGEVLHRPALIPIPRLVAKLPFGVGELAESLLFEGQRVQPQALEDAGYGFQHRDLRSALEAVL